ncbi:hypothetical protein A7D27_12790 [Pseudomonas sp. 1D4]|nr:hypothetical protein A7D27_12790 [Pseudomonas sp. 1D4]
MAPHSLSSVIDEAPLGLRQRMAIFGKQDHRLMGKALPFTRQHRLRVLAMDSRERLLLLLLRQRQGVAQ